MCTPPLYTGGPKLKVSLDCHGLSILPAVASVCCLPGPQHCVPFLASIRACSTASRAPWAAKTAASCNVLLKYVQNSCQFPQNSWSTVLLSPDGDICNTRIYIYIYIYLFI